MNRDTSDGKLAAHKPPAGKARQTGRKHARTASARRSGALAGYVVLGLGVLAVAGVTVLAVQRLGTPVQVAPAQVEAVQTIVPTPAPSPAAPQAQEQTQQAPAPENAVGMTLPEGVSTASENQSQAKDGQVAPDSFAGSWVAALSDGKAFLFIKDGAFQIILEKNDTGSMRLFSRGVVYGDGESLVFEPRADFGRPEDADIHYTYYTLTMRPYAVAARREGQGMLWRKGQAASVSPENSAEGHPLFQSAPPSGEILWQPLN